YAASAVEPMRGAVAPPGWEDRARGEFLDGYMSTVDPTLVPPGPEAVEKLLSVFELEKAVYELRYELNMRPDWVPIPVAGILRTLGGEPVTTCRGPGPRRTSSPIRTPTSALIRSREAWSCGPTVRARSRSACCRWASSSPPGTATASSRE